MRNSTPTPLPRIAAACAVGLLTLTLAGCVYQLGSSLPPNLKTVYVPAFVNQCGEPQAETEATQAAIAEFQRDGSLEIVPSASEADLVVAVTLSSYKLEPLRYEKDQPKTTREYRLQIGASMVVTGCPVCMLQLRDQLGQKGLPVEVKHLIELVDEAGA